MTNSALQAPVQDLLKTDIFELLGMAGLASKQHQDISMDMITTIQNRVAARLEDALMSQDQDALIAALFEKRGEDARALLSQNNLPSLETMAVEEALIYKHQIINELTA